MINYQKELEKLLNELEKTNKRPKLMLHSCCGPCSSYVLDYLKTWFDITVYYYNPNIYPFDEYEKRKNEQIRLINMMKADGANIEYLDGDYDYNTFLNVAKGFEKEKEGGERCHRCYEFRLRKTAAMAQKYGCDFFATTLTVSPYKNAEVINTLGEKIEKETGNRYLLSDFKKKNGYLKSIQLSKLYELYRQNYCGCGFSMAYLFENNDKDQ